MNAVKVIDAPCGTGKTSWAIQEMNRNTDTDYIYCTPFLVEIIRARRACSTARFKEPIPDECTTKLSSFTELLEDRSCIAVTHSTFLNADARTIDAMASGKYTLILDEVLEVVTDFNNTHIVKSDISQTINKGDMELLIEKELISIGDNGLVQWTGRSYIDCKFSEVERLAKLKRLYYVRDTLLICVFPPEVFRVLNDIYVMTHRFESSMLRAYFELFNIPYELVSVKKDAAGDYCVCEYDPEIDLQFRRKLASLVHIRDDDEYNFEDEQYRHTSMFSSTWWSDSKRSTPKIMKRLSIYIDTYIRSFSAVVKNEDIMWTCPKDEIRKLPKRTRFSKARTLTTIEPDEFNKLSEDEKEAKLNSFVPCNIKASNLYSKRWVLIYLSSLSYNPVIRGFFVDDNAERVKNGEKTIELDDDAFALSALIQWICRSRVRNNEPVELYLPSKRMRKLFIGWLNEGFKEDA